jgi:tetratricopeptide (TPR) repeat protein
LNRLPEAESLLREAAALNSRNKRANDPDAFTILGQLSYVLEVEGKYAESYQVQRDALAAERATLRPDDPVICDAWETLGGAAHFIGRLEEEEQDERNALSVCLQSYEADGPDVQSARYILGNTLRARGKFPEAEVLLRQALAGYQKAYGPAHRATAGTEDALGRLLREEGRVGEAREYGEGALQIQSKIHPNSLDVVRDLRDLAQTDYAAGNLEQASQEIERAVRILDTKFPDGRNFQATATESVATEIRSMQNDLRAAEQAAHLGLDSAKTNFPEGVLDVAQAESALGWTYYLEGRTAEGCPLLRSALTSDDSIYGPLHPYTAQVGIRLAACNEKAGRQEEADELIRKYHEPLLASRDGTYRVEQRWLKTHPSSEPKLVSQAIGAQPLP